MDNDETFTITDSLDESQRVLSALELEARNGIWSNESNAALCGELKKANDRMMIAAAMLKILAESGN